MSVMMEEQAPDDAALDGAGILPKAGFEVLRHSPWFYLREVLRLSVPQKGLILIFVGLTLAGSFVQMMGLWFLAVGFATADASAGEPPPYSDVALGLLSQLRLERLGQVLALFSLFLVMTLLAAALMHLSWIIRLKMLSVFEGDQTYRALQVMQSSDPRDRVEMPHRPTILALRGDCVSMRVVLQILLLIGTSLLTIVFPLLLIVQIDPWMGLTGLAITAMGFYPVTVLARRASAMSLQRQDVHRAAGSEVSSMLQGLQSGEISDDEDAEQKISAVRSAISQQHQFWRRQYEMRSLAVQIPTGFSMLASFVVLLWGVLKISESTMTWGELLTFVVATRIVFVPFAQVGNRWIKLAEHLPRAARHLDFMMSSTFTLHSSVTRRGLPERDGVVSVSEVRIVDRAVSTGQNGAVASINAAVGRGDILAIVDPDMAIENRFRRELLGEARVPSGRILIDGVDFNEISHLSIRRAIATRPQGKEEGPFLACVQRWSPRATEREVHDFVEAAIGGRWSEWLPDGLGTVLTRTVKVSEAWGKNASFLMEIHALLQGSAPIAAVDFFRVGDPDRRQAMVRAVRFMRRQRIILWFDTAPRSELESQTLIAFRNGVFLGQASFTAESVGSLHEQFSGWDFNRVNKKTKSGRGDAEDDLELVYDEPADDEEI
jgi:ABC-type multidrug transport system fused ATPase/permease subunit